MFVNQQPGGNYFTFTMFVPCVDKSFKARIFGGEVTKSGVRETRSCVHQPIPICEMDSSSLWDVAFAMASGSSRGKGNTSLTDTDNI